MVEFYEDYICKTVPTMPTITTLTILLVGMHYYIHLHISAHICLAQATLWWNCMKTTFISGDVQFCLMYFEGMSLFKH